jgi:hypothetical protein
MDVDEELKLQTEDGFCRYLETKLRRTLYAWKHMPVDMVVEPVVDVPIAVGGVEYGEWLSASKGALGLDVAETTLATDPHSEVVSHMYIDQLATEEDVEKIVNPTIEVDREATALAEKKAHEIFDGAVAIEMQGYFMRFSPWDDIPKWHGIGTTLLDLADRPELMHKIMSRYTDASLAMLDQLEEQGLLGSVGSPATLGQRAAYSAPDYTDELPADGFDPARPRPRHSAQDCWTHGAAQLFAGVSPAMHQEFEIDYAAKWYSRFGLVHYGCCDELHHKIDVVRQIPNLRKIAMGPRSDVEKGAEQIAGDFVFSRHPNPAVFVMDPWEPDAVERDLRETLETCDRYGCPLQIIMKDISTVRYKPERLWEWADIAMRVVGDGQG